jgi:hypothetical protein
VGAGGQSGVAHDRRVTPLREGDNVLGRDPDAFVRIDVPGVSRRHARIVLPGGHATVEDLGSKNGSAIGSPRPGPPRTPEWGRQRNKRSLSVEPGETYSTRCPVRRLAGHDFECCDRAKEHGAGLSRCLH